MSEDSNVYLSEKNEPFTREQDAKRAMKERGQAPEEFEIVPLRGGFAYRAKTEEPEPATKPAKAEKPAPRGYDSRDPHAESPFWLVRWQGKQHDHDTDEVELCVNGAWLIFERGVEVVAPSSYLTAADNATYHRYEQRAGMERKVVGQVKVFPYDKLRPATREEFVRQKASGNKARDEQIRRDMLNSGAGNMNLSEM